MRPLCDRSLTLTQQSEELIVWGPGLKAGLRAINEYYKAFPQEAKKISLFELARHPPVEGNYFVSELWDRHLPN